MGRDDIRNVFRDPQPGDAIIYDGDTYTVTSVERRPGKTMVHVAISGDRRRSISKEAWLGYEGEAEVAVNRSVLDAFE